VRHSHVGAEGDRPISIHTTVALADGCAWFIVTRDIMSMSTRFPAGSPPDNTAAGPNTSPICESRSVIVLAKCPSRTAIHVLAIQHCDTTTLHGATRSGTTEDGVNRIVVVVVVVVAAVECGESGDDNSMHWAVLMM
jgi:hypothetical protein